MKCLQKFFLVICMLGVVTNSYAQENETQNTKQLIRNIAFENLTTTTDTLNKNDSTVILEFKQFLKTVGEIEDLNSLSGSIKFGFTGNESDNNDLYVIQSGMDFKSGIFPLNVEADINIQTQIENGNFNEVVSNIDLSVDYIGAEAIHEGYAFVKRTRNTFLGINQRYEIGGGYVANLFLSPMKKGKKYINELEEWEEEYSKEVLDTIQYYKDLKETFGKDVIEELFTEVNTHKKVAKIKYSRYRLAFLIGVNSETEQTQEDLPLYDGNNTLTGNFDGTNIFRLVLAPKFELRGEKFHWSNTVFGKIRIGGDSDRLVDNAAMITDQADFLEDDLNDFWLQFRSNFEFKLSKSLALVASVNYIYDNAPKRIYCEDSDGLFQIAAAEDRYLGTTMTLKYSF